MHTRLLAVGDRQPAWVDDAFEIYSGRLPREWRFRLNVLATAKRAKNQPPSRAIDMEARQLEGSLAADERVVLLDERGKQLSSKDLAIRLAEWQTDGRNLAFIIGGPDGVAGRIRERADFCWSLGKLTLPHGLARVLLAEQLYRAWSLQTGHPYHRV
jgi:23S rRNA (pseudouridine1915-N3)-methyltransferase